MAAQPLTVQRTGHAACQALPARRRMASRESHANRTQHRCLVDTSRNYPRARARSQRPEHCAKPWGAMERERRQFNPDRLRADCRPVSDNSVFLSGDGVDSAPLMRTRTSIRTSIDSASHILACPRSMTRVKVSDNDIHVHSMVLIHCCRCASPGQRTSCAAMDLSAAFSKVIVLTCVTAPPRSWRSGIASCGQARQPGLLLRSSARPVQSLAGRGRRCWDAGQGRASSQWRRIAKEGENGCRPMAIPPWRRRP
jgi:hypothetical protein